MTRVALYEDEMYPFCDESKWDDADDEVDVPDALWARWLAIRDEFYAVQGELSECYRNARSRG